MRRRVFAFILWIFVVILLCINGAKGVNSDIDLLWTDKMTALHEAAEVLRRAGYSDDDLEVKTLSEAWWREYNDLKIVANVIFHEAGGCTWDHMVAVGAVIINRVNDPRFPDTVYDVVVAPLQYSKSYVSDFGGIPDVCWRAAIAAINGEHDVPSDIVWQAEFIQGTEIWKIFEVNTPYYHSTTYFCR